MHFNPQGSREPRLKDFSVLSPRERISIHKALASLDEGFSTRGFPKYNISIHKALASLYDAIDATKGIKDTFQSTRLSRASTQLIILSTLSITISIHKALTSLDFVYPPARRLVVISIHKALASLDRAPAFRVIGETAFQSTRLSRASTIFNVKIL